MEVNYRDESVREFECALCKGLGCTYCGMTGTIQMRVAPPSQQEEVGEEEEQQQQQVYRSAPKIIINASDYEKDQLITQIGKLRLSSPVAQKEYSMAMTLFREVENLSGKLQEDEYIEKMREVIEKIEKYQIDHLKPVKDAVGIISELEEHAAKIFDRIRMMAAHFEVSLELMSREHRLALEKNQDLQDEFKELKQTIFQNTQPKPRGRPRQEPMPTRAPEPMVDSRLPPEEIESEDEEEEENESEPIPAGPVQQPEPIQPKPRQQSRNRNVEYEQI